MTHSNPSPLPTRSQRYGPDAWLIEFAIKPSEESYATAAMMRQQLQENPPPHLREVTFSYTRVLLEFESSHSPAMAPEFYQVDACIIPQTIKTLEVLYDGEDLERVANHCRLTIAEVIEHHSAPLYRVHCLGFAPGFPYLSGLPECLHTPRLASPRIRIAAGTVAIGAGQTGIYPLPTAGGWNLIGRVQQSLFDANATLTESTFLQAGDRLRFIPVSSFSL